VKLEFGGSASFGLSVSIWEEVQAKWHKIIRSIL
jgi:hypothetical protein